MNKAACALLAIALAAAVSGCSTKLVVGERLYREGDRLGALETWRTIPEDSPAYPRARERIGVVEEEFEQLVVRYKQRGQYFQANQRLAESVLNYRLALKLQPGDSEALERVQDLVRRVRSEKRALRERYRTDFASGDLARAGEQLALLRRIDPFDPDLEADERELRAALHASVASLLASGRQRFGGGNYDAAQVSFEQVLEIDPDNESARGYLSYIESIRRESRDSRASYDPPQVHASDSEIRAEGFYQNARAAEQADDPFEAIRLDVLALQANPRHAGADRHLREIRRELIDRVEPLIEVGRTQFKSEDLQSALDSWRRALLVDPDNERARAYAARAEHQLENLERLRSEPDVSTRPR